MKWYFKCLKQYVDFSGRARRKEYWMFVLFNMIVSFVLGIVDFLIGATIPLGVTPIGIISSVYTLAVFLPGLAVLVRRLHDIGKSGWNILWYFLLAFMASVLSTILPIIAILLIICSFVVSIIFIVWMCKDSQPGDNKWGANPKMA